MARTNKDQDERKKKKRAQRHKGARTDRHQTRQDLKGRRTGALDRFAAQNQGKMDALPPEAQAQIRPMVSQGIQQVGAPQIQPAVTAGGLPVDPQKQPQVMPPVAAPSAGVAMQPAQVFDGSGQAATPDPVYQDPSLVRPMPPEVMPPETGMPPQEPQLGAPMPAVEPAAVSDPVTGEVAPAVEPASLPPVTPEEAVADQQLDAAVDQGKQFDLGQPPAMAPPEQFQQDLAVGGQSAAVNPRQIERMRRKRLALLNPKVQQLRPWGRGMPQVRYQGGPAFEGAFQGRPAVGRRPQPPSTQVQRGGEVRPQYRQPLAR